MVSEKSNHAWNVVCIGGKWFHLDATWGDMEKYGIDHDYFLISERKLFRLDKSRRDMVYYGQLGIPYKASKKGKAGFWNYSQDSYYKKIKKIIHGVFVYSPNEKICFCHITYECSKPYRLRTRLAYIILPFNPSLQRRVFPVL